MIPVGSSVSSPEEGSGVDEEPVTIAMSTSYV